MEKLIVDESKINYKVERQVKVRDILIDVPLKYRCSAINAVFPISSKEARNVINCSKLKPYELFPGKSLLCITLFNFHSGPVGPYTEMTLSIPVRYNPKFNFPTIPLLVDKILQKVSFFVFSIAQSTEIAIEHGNKITGYPHYSKLINVEFLEDAGFITANVTGEGKKILSFKIEKLKNEKIKEEVHTTYLIKDGKIFTIEMKTYGIQGRSRISEMILGDHELVALLKKLKITPIAIDTRYYRDIIKIIPSPRVVGIV